MVFSKRMEALADLCQGARRVIDVGCDHAQLCALLVTEYGVEHALPRTSARALWKMPGAP